MVVHGIPGPYELKRGRGLIWAGPCHQRRVLPYIMWE